MVRFSSNVKRPRAVVKQNNPLVSKEAPANISGAAHIKNYFHSARRLQNQQLHGHSRSLLSNSEISVIQEVGLSSSQAIKKLIEEIDRLLRDGKGLNAQSEIKRRVPVLRYASLLVSAIWSIWKLKNWSVGAFCAFILITELFFIEFMERRRAGRAVSDSIQEIRAKLRKLDKALLSGQSTLDSVYSLTFEVPVSSATSYVRVIRDGKIRLVCLNLLVPGDFVILLAGERLALNCCAFQPINLFLPAPQKKQMGLPLDASIVQIEDFPVTQVFRDQLQYPRRTRFVFSMLQERFQSFLSFTIVLAMNSVSIVPLVILSSSLLHFFWWLCGSCYLSLLSDQLIRSETPFKESLVQDSADVDEFDEDAPPPVKNIKIPFGKVFLEAARSLLGNNNRHGGILRLWDGDVIEALALTSVLCFTDREGPISNSHSRPCELIVPTTSDLELAAIELIPTSTDPQRVRPSLNHGAASNANDLRAIGLSMLLCTGCGCRADTPHSKYENILKGLGHFLPEHLQTCYCNLAKEIGFDPLILNRFREIKTIWHQHSTSSTHHSGHHKHVKKSSTVSVLLEDLMASTATDDTDTEVPASGHLFTFGEVSDILKMSAYTYAKEIELSSGSRVTGLSESLKRKLVDFEGTMRSCDVRCVAFSYRPIFEDEEVDDNISHEKHVFLGLISVCHEPKEHFQEFIDDLEAAGVRFAYFSPYREQPSKAFGERLGLETDWNSCILLSEHPNPASQSPGYSALSDIKARLPRGIQAIRPHLESVDDIPLHVSIFAECNNQNSSEMIKIYQEAGEVVGLIGSCRSIRNSKCFGVAHFSIGFDPMSSGSQSKSISFDEIALGINANSIKLILPAGSSPYIMTELIRESRTILQNSINAWEFVTGSLSSLIVTFAYCKLSFYEHLALSFAVLTVALAIAMGPFDGLVMKTHPTVLDSSKCPNNQDVLLSSLPSTITIIRFIPSLLGILSLGFLFKKGVFVGILTILLVQSFAFCHAYEALEFKKIHQLYPKLTVVFMTISIACILCTFFTCKFNILSFLILLAVPVAMGCLCLMWHETIKSVHLKDHYEQAQKRAKLLFNTKLGMHSPI